MSYMKISIRKSDTQPSTHALVNVYLHSSTSVLIDQELEIGIDNWDASNTYDIVFGNYAWKAHLHQVFISDLYLSTYESEQRYTWGNTL